MKADQRGNSTEQKKGVSLAGEYGIQSTLTVLWGSHRSHALHHKWWGGVGLCVGRAVEACPPLLVLNDLETEITLRLPC